MPRNKGSRPTAVASGPKWYGYIRCEFDAAAKQSFNEWSQETPFDRVWEWFYESVSDFKFTFSWADQSGCFQVSMTGSREVEPMYFGWTLTARGRDIERTLRALMYKHEIMLKCEWTHNIIGEVKSDDWVQ